MKSILYQSQKKIIIFIHLKISYKFKRFYQWIHLKTCFFSMGYIREWPLLPKRASSRRTIASSQRPSRHARRLLSQGGKRIRPRRIPSRNQNPAIDPAALRAKNAPQACDRLQRSSCLGRRRSIVFESAQRSPKSRLPQPFFSFELRYFPAISGAAIFTMI